MNTPNTDPRRPTEGADNSFRQVNLTGIQAWLRAPIRLQVARGWLVAAGLSGFILLLLAID